MRARGRFLAWLDDRTGLHAARRHLLDEPLPGGTGWWFTTGSVLLFLLGVQLTTGVVLALYYVPSPAAAYDSVRFIMEGVRFGGVVRGLHFFGASFIVIAAVLHMLRVVLFGSYKKPREVTWLTGVVLLLVILAFALSGYLLPWDQKAYWATTVTINIARSGPFGEQIAGVLQGGEVLGALTLVRWYTAHVILLPAALVGFVVAHLYLMRRHGISGPLKPSSEPARPFYPYHALKDTLVIALVFSALLAFAVYLPAPLEVVADPTDDSYIPRPEWYFLSLFQLLKYFPGPLEPIATVVIPGVVVALLIALPFLDRGPDRHPLKRPVVTAAFGLLGIAVVSLTYLGVKDAPAAERPGAWGALAIAGAEFAQDESCASCHRPGGAAAPIADIRARREPEWLFSHVRDPQVIAPGLRPPPAGGMTAAQAHAVVAYLDASRSGGVPPALTPQERSAVRTLGLYCANCHQIDGHGEAGAPDLTAIGASRDAEWLRNWITWPEGVDPSASMPPFGDVLSEDEMNALVDYLAARSSSAGKDTSNRATGSY